MLSSFRVLSLITVVSFAGVALSSPHKVQDKIEIKIAMASVGSNSVSIKLTDAKGEAVKGANVEVRSSMVEMDMGTEKVQAKEQADGAYLAKVNFSMAGKWRLVVTAKVDGKLVAQQTLESEAKKGDDKMPMGDMPMEMPGMSSMGSMHGRLGDWGMQKEGSGTSLLPESSPMFMKFLGKSGRYEFNYMGSFSLNYGSSGGPRGEQKFYSNSMPMLMVQNQTGGGILDLDLMMSLDPIFNGEVGYPDLFQTGETAHGSPLIDHQHPHNFVSELAATYSHPIGNGYNAFIYGGPIGEPALGGPMFLHRPSGMEIPEAPITHHWFDSTHISSGVVTLGANSRQWQLEGSVFNGHEPGENRYWPQPISFNSYSGRLTFNPSKDLSLAVSYGYLGSPEQDMPGVNQNRTTASAIYSLPIHGGDNLSATAYWGRIAQSGTTSDAYTLEASYYHRGTTLFSRWENVDKDELVNVPAGTYNINKVLFGASQDLKSMDGFDFGVGAYAGMYSFPGSLDPYYGRSPVSLGIFFRIRPSRMGAMTMH